MIKENLIHLQMNSIQRHFKSFPRGVVGGWKLSLYTKWGCLGERFDEIKGVFNMQAGAYFTPYDAADLSEESNEDEWSG